MRKTIVNTITAVSFVLAGLIVVSVGVAIFSPSGAPQAVQNVPVEQSAPI